LENDRTSIIDRVTAVILAGGKSGRMGMDKALIRFGDRTLLERSVEKMSAIFSHVIVAGGKAERYPGLGVPVVDDRSEGKGPIAGLCAGLRAAATDRIFAVACDTPFPNENLIRHLIDADPEADWIIPITPRGFEPLFAVYSKNCLAPMEEISQSDDKRIICLFTMVKVHRVTREEVDRLDPNLESFININTPEDVDAFLNGGPGK